MSQPTPHTCQRVDMRDEFRCQRCGKSLYVVAGSRHHRKLRSQCSSTEVHTVSNLMLLCGSGTTGCHGWVHAHPAEAYDLGFLVHSYDKPKDIPYRDYNGDWVKLTTSGTRKLLHFEMEE